MATSGGPADLAGLGPAELVQLTTAARRYHLDGHSKVEIGRELGVSRFKVARLLDQARARGLVRIEVGRPAAIDADLSEAVRTRYGYRHVLVADTHEAEEGVLRAEVSGLAARHLVEVVRRDDVVGIAWGRSLYEMTARLAGLPPCTVVQLCGVLSRSDVDASSVDLTRRVAEVAGGSAVTFYAPLVVPSDEVGAALREEQRIAGAIREYARLAVAVVSIGAWGPGLSTVYDALNGPERRELRASGAVAETCGLLFDADGDPLHPGLGGRAIGVGPAALRRAGAVVALAYGADKAAAVRAVRAGGIGTSLVTHTALAERLLALSS